jgi:hypothetical protein
MYLIYVLNSKSLFKAQSFQIIFFFKTIYTTFVILKNISESLSII